MYKIEFWTQLLFSHYFALKKFRRNLEIKINATSTKIHWWGTGRVLTAMSSQERSVFWRVYDGFWRFYRSFRISQCNFILKPKALIKWVWPSMIWEKQCFSATIFYVKSLLMILISKSRSLKPMIKIFRQMNMVNSNQQKPVRKWEICVSPRANRIIS